MRLLSRKPTLACVRPPENVSVPGRDVFFLFAQTIFPPLLNLRLSLPFDFCFPLRSYSVAPFFYFFIHISFGIVSNKTCFNTKVPRLRSQAIHPATQLYLNHKSIFYMYLPFPSPSVSISVSFSSSSSSSSSSFSFTP